MSIRKLKMIAVYKPKKEASGETNPTYALMAGL
jgi:hypothetical protein